MKEELLGPETPEAAKSRRDNLFKELTTIKQAESVATQPEWRVDKFLPKVGVVVICGAAKLASKTFLMLELARSVSQGKPFLGKKTQSGIVLFANVEDGAARLGWRAKMLTNGMGPLDDDADFLLMKSRDGLSSLMACIDDPELKADVIIIDPMVEAGYVLGLKNENDPLEVAGLIRPFRDAAQKCQRLIILVHHFRKDGDMARGSSALQGAVDGWIDIFPGKENNLRFIEATLRDGPPVEMGARLTFSPTTLEIESVDAEEAKIEKPVRGKNGGGNGGGNGGQKKRIRDSDLYDEMCLKLIRLNGERVGIKRLSTLCGVNETRGKAMVNKLEEQALAEHVKGLGVRWLC